MTLFIVLLPVAEHLLDWIHAGSAENRAMRAVPRVPRAGESVTHPANAAITTERARGSVYFECEAT
jgi:hypothetical protein